MKKISKTKIKKRKLTTNEKNTRQHPIGNQDQPTLSPRQRTIDEEHNYKKVQKNIPQKM